MYVSRQRLKIQMDKRVSRLYFKPFLHVLSTFKTITFEMRSKQFKQFTIKTIAKQIAIVCS